MIVESIEKAVNAFLQRKINFVVNNKIVKSGKLLLFCIKDFHLVFTIQIQNTRKVFEVPYPFNFNVADGRIILNYNVKNIHHNDLDIENNIKLLSPKKPTKYFNSVAEIIAIEEEPLLIK